MATKHALEMTDAEFAAAMHRRAWRTTVADPKPSADPLLANDLTDEQFAEAVCNRAWRNAEAPK